MLASKWALLQKAFCHLIAAASILPFVLLLSMVWSRSSPSSILPMKRNDFLVENRLPEHVFKCSKDNRSQSCQQRYGSSQLFIDPRVAMNVANELPYTNTMLTLDKVVDLRCTSTPHPTAYYHAFANCLLSIVPFLSASFEMQPGATWLIQNYHWKLFQGLNLHLNVASNNHFSILPDTILATLDSTMVWYSYLRPDLSAPLFRKIVYRSLSINPPNHICHSRILLYVWRSPANSRYLTEERKLLLPLARATALPVVYFWGNETLLETVQLFSSAKVIIAPHGAGIVNCLFCQTDAILVEITHLTPLGQVWRTNTRIIEHSQVKTFILPVKPPQSSLSKVNTSAFAHYLDPFIYLKSIPFVLSNEDVILLKKVVANFSCNH